MVLRRVWLGVGALALTACDCGTDSTPLPSTSVPLPAATCAASGAGTAAAQEPTLVASLADRYAEGWLSSPAVADLDGDGTAEIVLARDGHVYAFHVDGSKVWDAPVNGRVWASPVVADLDPGAPGLEVAVTSRDMIHAFHANGTVLSGYPIDTNRDELRSIAAGDIDGVAGLEIVAVSTTRLEANGQRDILLAYHASNGAPVAGFPPNTTGASGCDDACYVTGGYDQNLALGNVDADPELEIFATQDNAYLSLHDGDGRAFDSASIFRNRTKFLGVRFLLDYDYAQQGYSDHESTSLQAHFTNSAPAIADLDGDGTRDLVVLGSVQNTSQSNRFLGVVVFALHTDGTRLADWVEPYYEPHYKAGLWDFDGTNVVGETNQISVVELFPERAGPEMVFAGFDGRVHCIDARGEEIWTYAFTGSTRVLTAGVAIADLSSDGRPEIVFATYSPDEGRSELVILDAGGSLEHAVDLPGRGAMAVPSIADVNADGSLEIVVALKGQVDREPMALVYTVPGSTPGCAPWPTGRGNLLRNGAP